MATIRKHNDSSEPATVVEIEVVVLSDNEAAISGDRELIDVIAKWRGERGLALVSFDIETDDFTLLACRALRTEGHSVTLVHFMRRE